MTSGVRKKQPFGNKSRSNLAAMHGSRGDNIQEIVGAIGPMEAKWGSRTSPAQTAFLSA